MPFSVVQLDFQMLSFYQFQTIETSRGSYPVIL